MFRYFLLFAWSNSSISPLTYLLLLPKCSDLCRLCFVKDRSSTYDSLTSYYNRIGDRFHDIGKWDQLNNNKSHLKRTTNQVDSERNSFKLNDLARRSSPLSDQSNSLIVKEIPSDTSSLTTVTMKPHHASNGLIVTTKRHTHL
jgi:hypothetical protein